MTYIFYLILDILFTLICYVTNPVVILFSNEHGELPYSLRWWQTYDNCINIPHTINSGVPKLFRYDFDKHYKYTPEFKNKYAMKPGYVEILDPNFTVWEKIQRYFCRNVWLYRNTAYGFSYEVCGRYVFADKVKTYVDYNYAENDKCYIAVVNDNRIFLNKTWSIFYTKKYCKWFYLRIYLGWKFKGTAGQSMIAFHINPFRLND